MKRILVGVDDRPASRAAVAWVCAQARVTGSEILAAHVRDEHTDEAKSGELLASVCEPAVTRDVCIETGTFAGDPAEALLALGRALDVDLVVLGRRGPPEPGGERVGAVVDAVACRTDIPLAVVPVDTDARAVERILIGVDGTAGSDAAVQFAAHVASELDASVTAVDAFDRHVVARNDPTGNNWYGERLRQLRTAWTGPLHDLAVASCAVLVADNHVADVLFGVSQQYDVGLLVVGLAERRATGERTLGGVDLALLRQLELPTVFVPVAEDGRP